MAKKFKILLLFISLSLSLCFMSNTYSRYVANTTGNLEVAFSKWQILLNNVDITTNSSSSIILNPVMEENDYIAKNTIAPTSKGYFDIIVDPSNVDVSFDYSINLEYDNSNTPDLVITKYAYIDKNYTSDKDLKLIDLEDNVIKNSMDYKNKKFEKFTIRVFFEWYEGENELMDDNADSTAGLKAAEEDTTFNVVANIKFEQKIAKVSTPTL